MTREARYMEKIAQTIHTRIRFCPGSVGRQRKNYREMKSDIVVRDIIEESREIFQLWQGGSSVLPAELKLMSKEVQRGEKQTGGPKQFEPIQFEGRFFIILKPTSLTAKIQKSPKAQVRVVHIDKLKHFNGMPATPATPWRKPETASERENVVVKSPQGLEKRKGV